jgi:hypothetical protein
MMIHGDSSAADDSDVRACALFHGLLTTLPVSTTLKEEIILIQQISSFKFNHIQQTINLLCV